MTYKGFLGLVWDLLFLKDFSFFPPIGSSLYSRETITETKKEETLTALVFLRSTTIVKNILCGFLTLLEKGTHKAHMVFAETVHTTESPQPHQTKFIWTAGITLSA